MLMGTKYKPPDIYKPPLEHYIKKYTQVQSFERKYEPQRRWMKLKRNTLLTPEEIYKQVL